MKNVQVNDLVVTIPRYYFYEFSLNGFSDSIFADSLESARDIIKNFLGDFPERIIEVSNPTTSHLLLPCDCYFYNYFSSSLCRVPLTEDSFYYDILKYFRFNVSSSVKVLFE